MRKFSLATILVFASSGIWADPLGLTWTVIGNGGQSAPQAGFSEKPFWYINNASSATPSVLAAYGLPTDFCDGSGPDQCTTGSTLITSPFTLDEDAVLHVPVSFLSTDAPKYDFADVLLLTGDSIFATLYRAYPAVESSVLNPVTPGVTLTPDSAFFKGDVVTLGPVTYGPYRVDDVVFWCSDPFSDNWNDCRKGGSTDWVTSPFAPGPGEYRLMFNVYNQIDTACPSGLAIGAVSVPEPSVVLTLGCQVIGLAFLFFAVTQFRNCQRRSPYKPSDARRHYGTLPPTLWIMPRLEEPRGGGMYC